MNGWMEINGNAAHKWQSRSTLELANLQSSIQPTKRRPSPDMRPLPVRASKALDAFYELAEAQKRRYD